MLWNDLQQYFSENPTALVGVYCVGYLVIVFAIKMGKDNVQFAMLVFKVLYFTVGLPLLIFNGLFKFFYRLIFKRPLTKNTSSASAPSIVINDNSEVQVVGVRPNGRNNWTAVVQKRGSSHTAEITGIYSGVAGGNASVGGEHFYYSVIW